MDLKHIYMTASTLAIALAAAMPAMSQPPTLQSNLVGTWDNVNAATRGTVRMIVTNDVAGFRIHTFGACSPTPCDHGAIAASPFSKSISSTVGYGLSATYNFGFAQKLVTAQRAFEYDGGTFLELETRTTFAAGDSRFNYMSTELFRRK